MKKKVCAITVLLVMAAILLAGEAPKSNQGIVNLLQYEGYKPEEIKELLSYMTPAPEVDFTKATITNSWFTVSDDMRVGVLFHFTPQGIEAKTIFNYNRKDKK